MTCEDRAYNTQQPTHISFISNWWRERISRTRRVSV